MAASAVVILAPAKTCSVIARLGLLMAAHAEAFIRVTGNTLAPVQSGHHAMRLNLPKVSVILRLFLLMTFRTGRFSMTELTDILLLKAVFDLRILAVFVFPRHIAMTWRGNTIERRARIFVAFAATRTVIDFLVVINPLGNTALHLAFPRYITLAIFICHQQREKQQERCENFYFTKFHIKLARIV